MEPKELDSAPNPMPMNSKFPDDLISAFHDGEVTPSEEAVARIQIGASVEAKRELEAYQQISKTLQGLPRQPAPLELAAAIMARAERESLLPLEEAAPGASHLRPVTRLSRRRVYLAGGAGLAVVAASIAVAVFLHPGRPQQAMVARNDILKEKTATRRKALADRYVALRDSDKRSLPVGKREGTDDSLHLSRATTRFAPSAISHRNSSMLGKAKESPAPVDSAKSASGRTSLFGVADQEQRPVDLMYNADLKTAKVGDVIEAFEKTNRDVAVVRLTVVNQSEGLDGIRKILVRNSRQPIQDERKSEQVLRRFATLSRSNSNGTIPGQAAESTFSYAESGPGQLMCVFLEGTKSEVAGVLKDLQNDSHIQQARVAKVISSEQFGEYAGKVVSQRKSQSGSPSPPQIVWVPADVVKGLTAEKSLDLDGRQGGSRSSDRKGWGWNGPHSKPAAAVTSQRGQSAAEQRPPLVAGQSPPALGSVRDHAPLPVSKDRESRNVAQRSYQVFFVLEDALAPDSSPAAAKPAAAASPNPPAAPK